MLWTLAVLYSVGDTEGVRLPLGQLDTLGVTLGERDTVEHGEALPDRVGLVVPLGQWLTVAMALRCARRWRRLRRWC